MRDSSLTLLLPPLPPLVLGIELGLHTHNLTNTQHHNISISINKNIHIYIWGLGLALTERSACLISYPPTHPTASPTPLTAPPLIPGGLFLHRPPGDIGRYWG